MINLPDRPILCLSIVAIVVVVVVLAYMRRTRFRMVSEGQVAVITRFRKFDRVAGPGLIQFNEHHDEIRHYVDVRNRPDTYRVDGLRSYGLPFGYTLNFWRRTDLRAAGREDPERLRDLALLNDDERRIQVVNLVRKAIQDRIADLEAENPVSNPEILQQVVPILPGLPRCNEMVSRLVSSLAVALSSVGVYLDQTQPFLITQVHLGAEVIDGFIRGRKLAMLRRQVPDLGAEALVRAFGMVEGLDAVKVNQMIMEGNLPATLEMRQTDDQTMAPRIKIRTSEQPQTASPPESKPASAPAPPPTVRPAAGKETLTPDDLSVLKRAPAYQGEKRQTG